MNKYTFLWSNAHQLFYMRGNIDSYIRYKDIPFNTAEHVFQVSHGSNMTCYLGSNDLERFVEEGAVFLDRQFSEKYIQNARKQCADHHTFFQTLENTDLSKQSNMQLRALWQTLLDHYSHTIAYFRSTQEEPSRSLIKKIEGTVTPEEFNVLLLSSDLDEINKEDIAWQELMVKGFERDLASLHLQRYTWLFQNALSYEDTIDELEQRLSVTTPRDIQKEKNELRDIHNDILTQYPQLVGDVKTLHDLAVLRPEVKVAWASTGYYALPLLQEIAKRVDEDLHTLMFYYRHEDVESLLENGIKLREAEVQERKNCTAYVIKDGKLFDFVGSEAERVEKEEVGERTLIEAKQLKGISARPGNVTGKVYILKVNDPESAKLFRKSFTGGVLVTSMTQPNVLDIARRASAIITNEGGMLCHAAIISREFGIPCIVGTHIATQVLKDGDLVEVDADKGVVRILK